MTHVFIDPQKVFVDQSVLMDRMRKDGVTVRERKYTKKSILNAIDKMTDATISHLNKIDEVKDAISEEFGHGTHASLMLCFARKNAEDLLMNLRDAEANLEFRIFEQERFDADEEQFPKKERSCKHCGNAACAFHHPICAEALYEHEQARKKERK